MSELNVRACEQCGASIYREHLDAGIAGYARGKLLCTHCLAEVATEAPVALAAGAASSGSGFSGISLTAEAPPTAVRTATAARSAANAAASDAAARESTRYKRPLLAHGDASTRCRTFHAKLNEAAIEYMNDLINEWVDSHPDVTIKFATSTIGIFEGKHPEPNLVVTIFY